jgi:hypothetical protein
MIVLLLCLFLYEPVPSSLKTVFTYLFIAIFAFAFSYKTVRYLTQTKTADGIAYADCENEKENSIEKDEITDFYYTHFFERKQFLLTEETFSPLELVVLFTTADYSHTIYSPPESLS